jgi:integrase
VILLAFRHGLRAAELCELRWDQVDSMRRCCQRESETSPLVFVSERGFPFTTAGFARMIERADLGVGIALTTSAPDIRR